MVIVPGCETLRSTTVSCLKEYRLAGGDLLFLGAATELVDAVPDEEGKALYENSRSAGFSRSELVRALEDYREVELRKMCIRDRACASRTVIIPAYRK